MKFAKCHPDKKHMGKGLCATCYHRDYHKRNIHNIKVRKKTHYEANIETMRTRSRLNREARSEVLKVYNRDYYKNNATICNNRNKINKKILKKNNPLFKLACTLRSRLYHAIKTASSKTSAIKELGCSIEFLKQHLESLFQPGMTWDNHGEWHIDHITPLASAKTPKDIVKACHYTNLQPLWAIDNLKKGAKYDKTQ